jgi:hypothetical protein
MLQDIRLLYSLTKIEQKGPIHKPTRNYTGVEKSMSKLSHLPRSNLNVSYTLYLPLNSLKDMSEPHDQDTVHFQKLQV